MTVAMALAAARVVDMADCEEAARFMTQDMSPQILAVKGGVAKRMMGTTHRMSTNALKVKLGPVVSQVCWATGVR